jgi:DNA-binding transcriptional ArsR family regulator
MKHDDDTTESLLSALSNPLRRNVLRFLIDAGTPMSPTELARVHRVTLKTMCHHVSTLVAVDGLHLAEMQPSDRGSVKRLYEPGSACRRPLVLDAIGLEVGVVR